MTARTGGRDIGTDMTAQPAAPAATTGSKLPHELDDRQRALAFFTVLTAVVLEVADTTIVNTALPTIRDGLGASPAAMQWIVAGQIEKLIFSRIWVLPRFRPIFLNSMDGPCIIQYQISLRCGRFNIGNIANSAGQRS